MSGTEPFLLYFRDYFAFIAFFLGLSAVGYWVSVVVRSANLRFVRGETTTVRQLLLGHSLAVWKTCVHVTNHCNP